jgi:hypothetical protein
MVAVFRAASLAEVVDPAIPEGAVVMEDWAAFQEMARAAECLVVAFESPEPCTEAALQAPGRLAYPPLILVTRAATELLTVVAHTNCFACVPVRGVSEPRARRPDAACAHRQYFLRALAVPWPRPRLSRCVA